MCGRGHAWSGGIDWVGGVVTGGRRGGGVRENASYQAGYAHPTGMLFLFFNQNEI